MSEQELSDAILRHSLQILRLSAGEQAAVDRALAGLSRELKALLDTRTLSGAGEAQIKALLAEADKAITAGYGTMGAQVDTHALALIVAEHTADIMRETFPVTVRLPTPETLASLTRDVLIDGSPTSAWWARQSEDTAFRFAGQVRQGVVNGETTELIVQRIVGKRGEPGIMETSRRNARALVHSSVLNAASVARFETFKGNQRLFKGVRWLATLDMNTCRQCAGLDGQAWDFDGRKLKGSSVAFRLPLAHWQCRCALTAVPKSLREMGIASDAEGTRRRAADGGAVVGDTSFDAWLARQTPAQTERFLGAKRAELYSTGKITLRDLVSGTGRELTLDEITAN